MVKTFFPLDLRENQSRGKRAHVKATLLFFASYGAREIWDCQSRLELLHVKSTRNAATKALVLTETLERHDIR